MRDYISSRRLNGQRLAHGKVFNNRTITIGPRQSNHILYGDNNGKGGHRYGAEVKGKSQFPASWSEKRILTVVSGIANNKSIPLERSGSSYRKHATIGGQLIRVVISPQGEVEAAFPVAGPTR